jgi:hypothetical protein
MRIYSALLGLAAAVVLVPNVTSARVVDLPSDSVGVTEVTYQQLKAAHCYYDGSQPDTAVRSSHLGAWCDPIVAQLAGQVIFRAEHHGELYLVNDGDGWPTVTRYLPDGIYQAGDTNYWVANGLRTRLPAGDEYRRILLTAQRNASMITYVSSANFSTEQQTSLRGRIVVMTDQNGALGYVADPIYGEGIRTLSQKNSAEFMEVIGQEVIHIKKSTIKKLTINNDWR